MTHRHSIESHSPVKIKKTDTRQVFGQPLPWSFSCYAFRLLSRSSHSAGDRTSSHLCGQGLKSLLDRLGVNSDEQRVLWAPNHPSVSQRFSRAHSGCYKGAEISDKVRATGSEGADLVIAILQVKSPEKLMSSLVVQDIRRLPAFLKCPIIPTLFLYFYPFFLAIIPRLFWTLNGAWEGT